MAESTKNKGRRSDPRTADGEEMVVVNLRRSVGRRGGPFYGPGVTSVPKSLADSLRLSPDLVETDGAGNPLPHTVAASVFGATTSASETRNAHPHPAHDPETGDAIEDEEGAPVSDVARRAAAIAENAEKGEERQGGTLAGESGSLDIVEREVHPLPGQTEATSAQSAQSESNAAAAASGNGGTGAGGGKGEKPLTKSELRKLDPDVLQDLARRNRVKIPADATKKVVVDKLYNARVTL